jgi:hypothetical protein
MLQQSTAKGVHQQPNRKHFSTCILKGCRAQLQMLQLLRRSTVCNTKALYAIVWVLQQAASHENRSYHFHNAPPNLKINVVSTWMGSAKRRYSARPIKSNEQPKRTQRQNRQRIDVQQKASCSAVGTRRSQCKRITSAILFAQKAKNASLRPLPGASK